MCHILVALLNRSVEQVPVDGTAGLHGHPVQGEVNLPDKW